MVNAFLFWIGRNLLRLRYRIRLKGYEKLFEKGLDKSGRILFLPSHPAEIDPVILFSYLGTKFKPRPLVVEHFFFLPGVRFFMNMVKAVPIPNFSITVSKWKLRRAQKTIDSIKNFMDEGDNFIIYPGGHLRTLDHEVIGGNSLVHKLLSQSSDIQPVLIRTTGLWGSMFSRALSGSLPDFWKTVFVDGLKVLLKNGIFFAPRRDVEIEFYVPEREIPRQSSRLKLNQFLEKWYNQYPGGRKGEEVKLVSYSFYKKDLPKIIKQEKAKLEKKKLSLSDDVKQEILKEVSDLCGRDESQLYEDDDLAKDLGLDSLDIAGLHAYLGEHFDVIKVPPGELKTIYDLYETAAGEKIPKDVYVEPFLPKGEWKEISRNELKLPEGETLVEAFLRVCDRMKDADACGDDVSGILTYKRMKIGALVLSNKFRELEGDRIGLLLPSSAGAYLCILAILLAGKVPVMLNWTVGNRALEHSREITELSTIITSMRFLDRLETVDFGNNVENCFTYLEDIKRSVKIGDKLRALMLSKKRCNTLMQKLKLTDINPFDPAVILFTSGTETQPKGVPLSHYNILNNQRDGISCAKLKSSDILLGALPPFHSFGFTVTGLLPIFMGIRVYFSPDPTDGGAIARLTEKRKLTLLCLAPSFYKYLFRVATPEQLQTVRMMVTGAEKAPDELFEYAKRLDKILLEGYGITECSPIVTLSREGDPPIGVGKPIHNVQIRTIHLETEKPLDPRELGEIIIKGPGVFQGYFGPDMPNPFIEIYGEKWYRSGDIGHLDEQGNLLIKGRLKRFVKIGGEMVSLGALEEELAIWAKDKAPEGDDKPYLAVAAREKEGEKTKLICLATFPLDVFAANSMLREKGFGQIVKLTEAKKVKEIPLTGTGKVHYRKLNEIVNA